MLGKTFLMIFALVVLIFNGKLGFTSAARLSVMNSKLEAVENRSRVPPSMPNPPTYLPPPPGWSSSSP